MSTAYEEQELHHERELVANGVRDVAALVDEALFASACRRFGALRLLVDRRLAAEEKLVSRLLRVGVLPAGDAERVRQGQRSLRTRLAVAWKELSAEDAVAFREAAVDLLAALDSQADERRALVELTLAQPELVEGHSGVFLVREALQ